MKLPNVFKKHIVHIKDVKNLKNKIKSDQLLLLYKIIIVVINNMHFIVSVLMLHSLFRMVIVHIVKINVSKNHKIKVYHLMSKIHNVYKIIIKLIKMNNNSNNNKHRITVQEQQEIQQVVQELHQKNLVLLVL